ncbi:putative type I inositol 1,4,5-trisphosphate 5-phosphatase [Ditylenchus destructor]|uniref:inositol-polyphosphate 5-phosphatase n=1 Tax=Ditylenchus destructor TaxID=166010 RepID=A0AAD4N445_9BILA|nr:putative type I inositol 1,4,5-trisphosphate 5-phosphatase [Ditylenchus destructor]
MKEVLLITSNVGSVFSNKSTIRKNWMSNIIKAIEKEKAKLVAINIQESGGKDFKQFSKDVPTLVSKLHSKLSDYRICRAFLDIDHEQTEEYTALSSIIFIHNSAVEHTKQYNFRTSEYSNLKETDTIISTDFTEKSGWARKEKFSRDFWPSIRWGRKGFLWTRWSLNKRILDLVNIHLFHDESNLAFLENPSQYSDNRAKALNYTLKQLSKLDTDKTNLFIFGDFNFRLEIRNFIKKITKQTTEREFENPEDSSEEGQKGSSSSESEFKNSSTSYDDLLDEPMRRKNSVVEYRTNDSNSSCLLRVGKKRFDFHDTKKLIQNWQIYREDDREILNYPLKELPISFPPTYPWSEDPEHHDRLMNTRAPAWCDRILMNETAWRNLFGENEAKSCAFYQTFAENVCTGDHKPVLLAFNFTSVP